MRAKLEAGQLVQSLRDPRKKFKAPKGMWKGVLFISLISLGVATADYRLNKRLQWNTFVVCPGGEVAFGQRCRENVEKKASPRYHFPNGSQRYLGRLLGKNRVHA